MWIDKLITTVDILLKRSDNELTNTRNQPLQSQIADIQGQILKLASEDRFTLLARLTPSNRTRLALITNKKQQKEEWTITSEQVKTLDLIKPIFQLNLPSDLTQVHSSIIDKVNVGLTKFSTNEERSALIKCLPDDKSPFLILLCQTNDEANKWKPLLPALPKAAEPSTASATKTPKTDTTSDIDRRKALEEAEAEARISALISQRMAAAEADLARDLDRIELRRAEAEQRRATAETELQRILTATAEAEQRRLAAETAARQATEHATAQLAAQQAAAAAQLAAQQAAEAITAARNEQLAQQQAATEAAAEQARQATIAAAAAEASAAAMRIEHGRQAAAAAIAAETERQRVAAVAAAEAAETERQRVAAVAAAEAARLASDAHHVSIAQSAGM